MGAFHNGRRCGTCCDGNDTVSPMCAGADWDGAFQLRKTSLLEVEARCSRDEACEGYYAWNKPPNYTDVGDMVRPVTRWGTTGGTFRFKSGKVYGWAKLERIACSWPDLRRRAADADARAAVPGPEHLLAPMREWADEAWARLQQSGDLGRMQLRADQLRNFTSSRLPSAARELPVLYLFGGADLLTTSWLFPSATRHTLMSALPLGQPSCFLQSACRAQAHKAAADYFQDWAHNSYAWTQSEYMVNYWFTPKVGVLPALLLSLRILGERLVAMERSSSYDEITLVGDSVETRYILEYGQLALQGLSSAPGHASGCPKPRPASASLGQPRPASASLGQSGLGPHGPATQAVFPSQVGERTRVTYITGWIASSAALERLGGQQYVSIIKAADGFATRFLNGPMLGRWLLQNSAAVLHDSTGMGPSVFSREAGLTADDWTVCTFGNLSSLLASHSRLNIDGANLLTARREGRFDGAELPMVYGYGKSTGRGIVLAAWRRGLGEAGGAAAPTECVASSVLARRVRPEDLRTYRCTGHDESLCRAY